MEIRNEVLSALRKTRRTGLQIDAFRRRLYEPKFLHLFIPRETLKSLMMTSPLAIKEKIPIKSAMVQTSKMILGDAMGVFQTSSCTS